MAIEIKCNKEWGEAFAQISGFIKNIRNVNAYLLRFFAYIQ